MHRRFKEFLLVALLLLNAVPASRAAEPDAKDSPPRDPVDAIIIPMDLTGARTMLNKHDLDDDGALSKTEWKRLAWSDDDVQRFDLNRNGKLQHAEIALKLADIRIDHGIVQMDSILAERYTKMYDADRDGKLSFDELSGNIFTDQLDTYDKNSDRELSNTELIHGLAWERRFRDELGIKGCDQGGAMKLINRGDKNGDKRIDDAELELAGLDAAALDFDRNQDGKLSVSELAERLAQRRNKLGLTPSDQLNVRGILRRLDRDLDGVIVIAELPPQPPDSALAKWDRNSDGKITEIEIETCFGEQRKALGYGDDDAKRAAILVQRNDTDNSRSLSRSELEAGGSDRSSPLSPAKLPLIDENRDNEINVDELARYLNKTRQ